MSKRREIPEYYCVAVKRNYETTWRFISKHDTREAAEAELESRRAYTGSFNYDNAELRVIGRAEAKQEFGASWEYAPIGGATKTKSPEKA